MLIVNTGWANNQVGRWLERVERTPFAIWAATGGSPGVISRFRQTHVHMPFVIENAIASRPPASVRTAPVD